MVSEMTPAQLAEMQKAADDPETGIKAQQAAAEKGNVDGNVEGCDTSDEGIRSRGGYMLMDPQWVAGGPWNGIPAEEMQGVANRRADIVERMKAGTVFGFTATGASNPNDDLDAFAADLAGYFPASEAGRINLQSKQGDARLDYSVQVGNELAACKADPNFYVRD
jgi:hypothetical protein